MKISRICLLIFVFPSLILLQACGSGTGASDTNGALSLSKPTATVTATGSGLYSVSSTITFTPPAGKTAQGVIVDIVFADSFGYSFTIKHSFTSNSNTVSVGDFFPGPGNIVSVSASIGDMRASDSVAF